MRLPMASWKRFFGSLGFRPTRRRRYKTTEQLKKEATLLLGFEQLEPRHMMAGDLSINDVSGPENGNMVFTVTLSQVNQMPVTVMYSTMNNSATSGSDYTTTSGMLMFNPGETTKPISVPITSDTGFEINESFFVNLSGGSVPISDSQGKGTILDDDTVGRTNVDPSPMWGGNPAYMGNVKFAVPLPGVGGVGYNTLTSPRPIIEVETLQPNIPVGGAAQTKAELKFNGVWGTPVYYSGTGQGSNPPVRYVLQADATGLTTGTYDWELKLTDTYGSDSLVRTITGKHTVVNRNSSPYGAQWWIVEQEQLLIEADAVSVIDGYGTTARYLPNGQYNFITPAGHTATLTKNVDNTYTLREKDGFKIDFDTTGKLTKKTDRNGNITTFTYDGNGQLWKVKDPLGHETVLAYTSGRLSSVTDYAGRVHTLAYDGSGRLTSVTLPDPDTAGPLTSPVWQFTYGTNGLLTEVRDPLLHVNKVEYDFAQRVKRYIKPDNTSDMISPTIVQGLVDLAGGSGTQSNPAAWYNPANVLGRFTDALLQETTYKLDRFGGYTQYTDALGKTSTFVRNADGRVTQYTTPDPDGAGPLAARVTSYAYDAAKNLTQITNPDSSIKQFTYDATFNQLTSFTDELGHQVLFTIDAANGNATQMRQVIGQVDPGGGESNDPVWTFSYTPAPTAGSLPGGLIVDQTDPLGRITRHFYQTNTAAADFGRLTSVNFAQGTPRQTTTTFEYDSAGNVAAATDGLGRRTAFAYDQLDRVTSLTLPDPDGAGPLASPVWAYTYDADSKLLTETDPKGFVTSYAYDNRDRLTSKTLPDPDGAGPLTAPQETYSYDADSRLTSIGMPIGSYSYQYNANDWVMWVDLPDPDGAGPLTQPRISYTYDNLGNVTSESDPLGNTTNYEYNSRDWLTKVTAPDPDGGGPLTRPVQQYAYNTAGLLTSETDPLSRVTSYVYNDVNWLTSVTLPDPDAAGPLTSPVTSFTYDKLGNVLTETNPLGFVTSYAYDELYRLTSLTQPDPDGGGPLTAPVTAYAYDAASQLTGITDPLSRVTSYVYDNLGRLNSVTDPDPDGAGPLTSPVSSFTYDANSNLLTETDPLGNVTSYLYDNLNRNTRITLPDPDGAGPLTTPQYNYTYDAIGNLTSESDPLSRVTSYAYDGLSRLTTVTQADPDGGGPLTSPVTTYAYDAASRLTSVTDPLNNVTSYLYDNLGRTTRVTEADPDGAGPLTAPQTNYAYDAASQLTSVTDALSNATSYLYDNLGRITRVTEADPDGGGPLTPPQTNYAYDANTNLLTLTDALGNVTAFQYDNLDRVKQVTQADPDGAGPLTSPITTYVYDAASQLTGMTDPLSRTTNYEYDNLGREKKVILPDPDGAGPLTRPETAYAYDAASNLTTVTDALGRVTQYTYDNLYRTKQVTFPDPDGAGPLTSPVQSYVYDAASQLTSETDPLNRTTSFDYDNLGRQTKLTQPDPDGGGPQTAPFSTFTYDAVGNMLSVTDPLGKTTNYEYDNLYRQTKELLPDPDGAGSLGRPTTTYKYDAVGNLTQLTDPVGHDTTWAYDNLYRVTQSTNELGNSRTFEYDAVGNRTKLTDRSGRVTEYTYDNLYRLTQERWKSGSTTVNTQNFAYDAADQLSSAGDDDSSYTYTYDALGRATLIESNNGGPQIKLTQSFDAVSNRTGLSAQIKVGAGSWTNDFQNTYTYDNLDRMTRVDQNSVTGGNAVAQKRVDFAYNAADQFTNITRYDAVAGGSGNLVATTNYTYDGIGRLTNLTHAKDATTIASDSWTYDAHSRVTQFAFTSLVAGSGTSNYSYDNTGQLTGADYDYQTDENYTYDENGNRTMSGYTTGTNNRLTSDGTYNYEYDNEANRTKKTTIATGDYVEYGWNHHNELTSVTFKNSSHTVTKKVEYEYDVFGRRTRKRVDANGDGTFESGQRFVYDGSDIVLVFDDSSSLTNRFLHGPDVDQVLADEQFTPTGPNELPTAPGDLFWMLADNLGSVRDIVQHNVSTNVTSVSDHITYDAYGRITARTNPSGKLLYSYTGREWDADVELFYYRARWYDPRVGRFIGEDPIGFRAGDANFGRYVHNSPTNFTDPSGLEEQGKKGVRGPFGNQFPPGLAPDELQMNIDSRPGAKKPTLAEQIEVDRRREAEAKAELGREYARRWIELSRKLQSLMDRLMARIGTLQGRMFDAAGQLIGLGSGASQLADQAAKVAKDMAALAEEAKKRGIDLPAAVDELDPSGKARRPPVLVTGYPPDVMPGPAGRLAGAGKGAARAAGGALKGGRLPALKGKGGEEAVAREIGVPRNVGPGRATVPGSGPGGFRVPDFPPGVTIKLRGSIVEVKHLKKLSITDQLRDLMAEARRHGVKLEIFTNAPKPKAGELYDAIEEGLVTLVPIP